MNISKASFLLLLTAAIWGLAFVAQRVGAELVPPFTFNGLRFLLGALSLVPLIWYFGRNSQSMGAECKNAAVPGLVAGCVLFIAASLQQVGIYYTTAGKAAFITARYIVLVPVIGIFLRQTASKGTWLGGFLALVGLYLLSIRGAITINYGDMLQLIGALFWASHILIIGYYSLRVDVLKLSCFQFLTCATLSLVTAAVTETTTIASLIAAAAPLIYGGIASVGIAYTLQAIGQKYAPPAHVAIILSMESVFAAIGGFFILEEVLGGQELIGCALMLTGMLVSQLLGLRNTQGESPSDLKEGMSSSN